MAAKSVVRGDQVIAVYMHIVGNHAGARLRSVAESLAYIAQIIDVVGGHKTVGNLVGGIERIPVVGEPAIVRKTIGRCKPAKSYGLAGEGNANHLNVFPERSAVKSILADVSVVQVVGGVVS